MVVCARTQKADMIFGIRVFHCQSLELMDGFRFGQRAAQCQGTFHTHRFRDCSKKVI